VARKRGSGEGGISRRKDGRWEGRYTVDTPSGRERRSVYGKTRKEAAQRLAQAIATKDGAVHRAVPGVTVRGFLVQYEDAIRDTVKRRSLETYQDIARLHLIPAFGSTKLENLTREQVQRMYSEKRDGGLSAARVRRIYGVLCSALNCAVRWRLVGHNVCKVQIGFGRGSFGSVHVTRVRETVSWGQAPPVGSLFGARNR
jgi:integrase